MIYSYHIVDHLMNKEPELIDLLNWLHDIAYVWYELGVQLNVPIGTLNSIDVNLRGQTSRKLVEVLHNWESRSTSPHTFGNLFECLEKINQREYANMLKQRLKNPEVYVKYNLRPDLF